MSDMKIDLYRLIDRVRQSPIYTSNTKTTALTIRARLERGEHLREIDPHLVLLHESMHSDLRMHQGAARSIEEDLPIARHLVTEVQHAAYPWNKKSKP